MVEIFPWLVYCLGSWRRGRTAESPRYTLQEIDPTIDARRVQADTELAGPGRALNVVRNIAQRMREILPVAWRRARQWVLAPLALGIVAALSLVGQPALGLTISPSFDTSIIGAVNAGAIENAIDASIDTIDGLYSNPTTVAVYFQLGPGNFLAHTNYGAYGRSYSSYVAALSADSLAHLNNTVLSTAISHLASGNDASGSSEIAATSALLRTLGFATPPCFNSAGGFDCGGTGYNFDAIITLSATQPLDYVRPIPVYNGSNFEYDAVGAIEHELDEVLGGGGPGSTLNSVAGSCGAAPRGFFCNKFGPTDLYRYSAPGNPSFTTSGSARPYLSVDGGSTALVGFNQNSSGDYGDFGPNVDACTPSGFGGPTGLIQDAFSCNNEQREDYTAASPEFAMMEAIGWDASATATVPEPGSLALFASALLGFAALRRHRKPWRFPTLKAPSFSSVASSVGAIARRISATLLSAAGTRGALP